jgi:cytochrome c oxidase subunit 3
MTSQRDLTGIRIGMWLFLYTEIILFGGLFVIYSVYFYHYSAEFAKSGKELDRVIGSLNTIILLISSFMVASSITALRREAKKLCLVLLASSFLCGGLFLLNKYFEWTHKISHGIYPNSPALANAPPGRSVFFGLYYVITGLHGVHVIIGMTLLALSFFFVYQGKITARNFSLLDNSGLYWHLVDLIWIFIFPLFYLIL